MFWLAGLFGGLMAGGFILLLQIIPYNGTRSEYRDFRRSLSAEELSHLKVGQTVMKVHTSFMNGGRSSITGPLKVERISEKKFHFTPYGKWQQVELNDNHISCEWKYTGFERETVTHFFNPDGSVDALMYWVPAVVDGDSGRECRFVYFKLDNPIDTAVVEHSYSKNGKSLGRKKVTWSYDTRGLRPVPVGWKFSR